MLCTKFFSMVIYNIGLVTYYKGSLFEATLLEERYREGQKWQEDDDEGEEEDVSSYWMTLRKREGTVHWKKKHWIAVCAEQALEVDKELT